MFIFYFCWITFPRKLVQWKISLFWSFLPPPKKSFTKSSIHEVVSCEYVSVQKHCQTLLQYSAYQQHLRIGAQTLEIHLHLICTLSSSALPAQNLHHFIQIQKYVKVTEINLGKSDVNITLYGSTYPGWKIAQ